jgi:hypothetical protein
LSPILLFLASVIEPPETSFFFKSRIRSEGVHHNAIDDEQGEKQTEGDGNDYSHAALLTHPPDQRHGLKPKLRVFACGIALI